MVKTVEPVHADWKFRESEVGHHGVHRIPRYITRVDAEDKRGPGFAGTHGWQVRYGTPPHRFFSDRAYGTSHPKAGLPHESLKAAQEHLLRIWKGHPQFMARYENPAQKKALTGMTGVRVIWRERPPSPVIECVVRVDNDIGRPLRVLYVATPGTFTRQVLKDRIEEAIALRQEHLRLSGKAVPEVRPYSIEQIMLTAPHEFLLQP